MDQRTIVHTRTLILHLVILLSGALALPGCHNDFMDDYFWQSNDQYREVNEIEVLSLRDRSLIEPVSVEEAANEMVESAFTRPEPPEHLDLSLAEVRAATLSNNLDLIVELINPSIAQATVGVEEAKFESTFRGSARRSSFDSPTSLATEASQAVIDEFSLGVLVPLQTGGTASVDFPFSKTSTNNPFATLDPSYEADVRFSISQPLLRNAGLRVNTHSIRVARGNRRITEAQTKLEAIRILANADRGYWLLYAAQQELLVRRQQYELALEQLEQARRMFDAGDVPEIEVTRAESGVASRVEAIIIAEAAVRRASRDLKRIMNRPDLPIDSPTHLDIVTLPQPMGIELDAEALAQYAVANRMEMLVLELQLALDASTIDFERNQALPLFTVDYTYNVNGLSDSYGGSFSQITDRSFHDWIVGLNVEIPLGNEAAKSRIHRAVLQRLQRLATKNLRRLAIEQEVYDALDNLEEDWQRILAARQAVILAARTYEGEQRQFEVGARTSTDVLDAAANLADAQSQEIRALTDYQISQIDIAFATGTVLGNSRIVWDPLDKEELTR